jgi:antitoxin ParD1/3/4
MSSRTTLNISVTPKLEKLIREKVASGRYTSASEVVREGLRLLEEREEERKAAIRGVRSKIAAGLRDVATGNTIDGELFFRELTRRSKTAKSRRA